MSSLTTQRAVPTTTPRPSAAASATPSHAQHPAAQSQTHPSQSAVASNWALLWSKRNTVAGRGVIAVTLLATILALWQAFSGTREARIANALALWSAKMDFYELCDSVSL